MIRTSVGGRKAKKPSAIYEPHERIRLYVCTECVRIFGVVGPMRRRPNCVECTESINVQTYKQVDKTGRVEWTPEEEQQLLLARERAVTWGALAIKFKRTRDSIRKKYDRLINGPSSGRGK